MFRPVRREAGRFGLVVDGDAVFYLRDDGEFGAVKRLLEGICPLEGC